MAETTDYMERLGVTPALFKKWQAEDDEADEPAPFQTHSDTLILAQRRRAATGEPDSLIVEGELALGKRQVKRGGVRVSEEARLVEEVIVGKTVADRVETASDTARHTDVEVEQTRERERARSH